VKPILFLDPEMPKTHMVPVENIEGRSLWNEWYHLSLDYQFADHEEPEQVEAARQACLKFRESHEFKEAMLIKEQTMLLGRSAAMRGYGRLRDEAPLQIERPPTKPDPIVPQKSPKMYVTHPDNILTMTEEWKSRFDIKPMKTTSEYMKEWGLE
jgi:hypothetical protein